MNNRNASPQWYNGFLLSTRHKVSRFKSNRGNVFSTATEIHRTPSFGEVKLEAPCRKILQHVKEFFHRQNLSLTVPRYSQSATRWFSCGKIAREHFGGRIVSVPQSTSSTIVLHTHIPLAERTIGPLMATVQTCSLIPL
jgi:hypothetical protein